MAAAISAARHGAEVIILEKNPRVGKKILSTGNGRCNFTNIDADKAGCMPNFCRYAVSEFTPEYIMNFFKDIGMLSLTEEGRVYPKSMQASAVLDVLRAELDRLDVRVIPEFDVDFLAHEHGEFKIGGKNGKMFRSRCVIMSTGGCAAPKTGSDGTGYKILKKLGHHVTPLTPALCRIKTDKGIQGVRQYGRVYLENGKMHSGEIQFAKDALSGIPVFDLAREVKKGDSIYLDLMPEMSEEEVYSYLRKRPAVTLETYFVGILNKSLGQMFLKDCGFSPLSRNTKTLTDGEIRKIAQNLKRWKFTAQNPESWDNAQVTCGGISLDEIDDKSMQSRIVKGLYVTGELLDVDLDCGGYNLHWAWASGLLAGREAACTE